MAFGPIMRFRVGELQIELAPLKREDIPSFIDNGGMQSHIVTKYLGRRLAPTLEDEYEWFDKTRSDQSSIIWGIYVVDGAKRLLVGNTGLHHVGEGVMRYAVTGCMIFQPEYWGKGIAGCAHRARTWYTFTQVQPPIVQLRSAVMDGNNASQKALENVGYVPVFYERNDGYVDGKIIGKTSLDCVNPLGHAWASWWHGDPVPKRYRLARLRTLQAFDWAHEHVSFG